MACFLLTSNVELRKGAGNAFYQHIGWTGLPANIDERVIMKQSPPDALYAYWTTLRGTAVAPRRFDIEPSRIAPLLSHTFILEKLGPRDYRYRIAGTSICQLFGLELREQSFFDGFGAADVVALERALAVVTRRGGVSWFEIEATRAVPPSTIRPSTSLPSTSLPSPLRTPSRQQPPIKLRGVLLPLLHSEGRIDRVLGAVALEVADPDASNRALDWIGREPLVGFRLAGLRTEWPRPNDSADNRDPASDLSGSMPAPAVAAPTLDPAARPTRGSITARLAEASARFAPQSPARSLINSEAGEAPEPDIDAGQDSQRQAPFKPHIRKSRIVRSDRRQFRVYDGGLNDPAEADDQSR